MLKAAKKMLSWCPKTALTFPESAIIAESGREKKVDSHEASDFSRTV